MVQTSAPGTALKQTKEKMQESSMKAHKNLRCPLGSHSSRQQHCSLLPLFRVDWTDKRNQSVSLFHATWQQPWNRGGAQNLEGKVRTFTAPSWALSVHRRDLTCLQAVYLGVCWRRYYCVLRAQPDVTAADAVCRKISTFNQHGTLLKNVIKSHITLFQSSVYLQLTLWFIHSSSSALSAY